MLKQDLMQRNPLHKLLQEAPSGLPAGGFGAVLARAGVGKTALLVQIALHSLFSGKNVLHISLKDPVQKVCLWYEEVFRNMAGQTSGVAVNRLWEEILPFRLIMTFRADDFSVPKLEERLGDLAEQDIFLPQVVLIDGLNFDAPMRDTLAALKDFAADFPFSVWGSMRIHRHEPPEPGELPKPLALVADLVDLAVHLDPHGQEVRVQMLKGAVNGRSLILDPATMLIHDGQAS